MSDAQFIEGARTKKTRSAPERVRGTGTILRRFADLVEEGPFGASFLRDRLMDGSLKSHKIARARLVYQRDWEAFLNGLGDQAQQPDVSS